MSAFAQLAIVLSLSLPRDTPPPVGQLALPPLELATPAPPGAPRQSRERDAWFGDDKLRHFFMSFATSSFTFAGMRLLGTNHDVALPVALIASAAAGIGKEIHDRAQGRRFSARDLVWDAAGTGAGLLLLRDVR